MPKPADIDPLLMEGTSSRPYHTLKPEKASSYLAELWAKTRDEVRHDFKSTRWRHAAASFFTWLGFSIWALGLVVFCLIFPLVITQRISLVSSDYWNYCAPDGSFSLEPTNFWNPDWAFQIVLAFGSLSFTQAKVVDIVWDIGVGRLGQSLLAYFSWKAFSVYVRASMETTPVTYRTYWTTFMQNHASIRSIFRLLRDFTTKRGLRSKVAMGFMILTMVFVMAFPTLASAMTGYTANNEAVIKFGNGTQTPFQNFNQIVAVIHDGGRVNLTDEYMVFKGSQPTQYQACGASNCINRYIHKYGILNDTDSTWPQGGTSNDEIPVKSPTLNITYSDGKGINTTFFYLPRNNNSYSLGYVQENAVCQPVMANYQQTYQWGFSVIQLETTLVLLTFWTFGVWILWLQAHHELSNRGRYEAPQDFKAALHLADSIRADLKEIEQQPDFMTNKKLEKSADEHLKGGRVEVLALALEKGISCRKSFWRWVKTNKLWLFMFICVLGTCIYLPGNSLAILTMTFAMAAGWGRKTRAIMSWAAWFVGIAIYLPILLTILAVD